MMNRVTTNQVFSRQQNIRSQSQVRMPSFANGDQAGRRILTHTAPRKTDEEFKEAIKEAARRDFERGYFQNSPETQELIDDFISVVSPDRRSIIENAMQANGGFSGLRIINLASHLPRGQTPIHFSHVHERSNRHISSIQLTNYGWDFTFTLAEAERSRDILEVYNNAWRAVQNEARSQGGVSGFMVGRQATQAMRIQTAAPSPQHVSNMYESMGSPS
ncbi:MAG: hypothetical protein FWF78_02840 [Defluviitaleaceae bacterium]|nr:hypothetical protein [Defluviitaleaceae bacterium]